MDGHIDWLSFTLPEREDPMSTRDLYFAGKRALKEVSLEHETYIYSNAGFDTFKSRAPYRYSLASHCGGFRVFGGSHTGTILFELSGRACEGIRADQQTRAFLRPIADRITRFDYAVDISTECKPSAFANARSHKGFRSVSFISSDTGETVYVGSPKSDRFARVYRYNPPHPRHKLMRVEFVFRGALAKAAVRQYLQSETRADFQAALGNTWGWSHAEWRPGVESDERVNVPIVERVNEDTIMWVYKQVAPALRRLVMAGAIDWREFEEFIFKEEKSIG